MDGFIDASAYVFKSSVIGFNRKRLIHWGFYDIAAAYQSVHVNY